MRREWLDHDEAALRRLRGFGLSIKEIADRMGRTESSIHSRLSLLKVPPPAKESMEDHPMREALCRPHTLDGVAEEYGTTRLAVASIKRRLQEAGVQVYRIRKRKEA
jgi:ParB-like chromosome segregation protein Spo0J